MIDYEWLEDGTWEYTDMVDEYELYGSKPDGIEARIEQLPVTEPKKTLGIWTNPAGDGTKQLEKMHDINKQCIDRLSTGKLRAR